jgi:hypothetical protein
MADRLKPAPDVLARRLPGGAVLVHMRTNRIFELNETGARIWELLHEGLDQQGLLTRLLEEFDVDADRAAAEVEAVLGQLGREGLVSTI